MARGAGSGKRTAKKATVKKTAGKAVKRAAKKAAGSAEAGRKTAGNPRAPKTAWLLNIDYSLCRGCGGCAEAYPRLFEMREERAWVLAGGVYAPVRDKGVLRICPYYAISVDKA